MGSRWIALGIAVSPRDRPYNYLLFSDVHLGADLVQHVRPWTVDKLKQVARIDRELCAMLDWYAEKRDPERPWRLVIAGDLVDFIGMSIAPLPELENDLTDEERRNGLGSTTEHAAAKMRAVARRHDAVFSRLAAFVAAGHSLVLVRGNHDVDFHWDGARRAFVDALLDRMTDTDAAARSAVESRIEFRPWFYYDEGLLYVEHGHQFDAMCSYHHLLCPVSPRDPRRISWSFSDILLRAVVRPTPGVGSEGHDDRGMLYYLRLGIGMGLAGMFTLASRFATAILLALRRWRAHLDERAQALREEHERRMAELAEQTRLGLDRVRALAALWPTPVTRGAVAVLRSMFVDRIVIGIGLALVTTALCLFLPYVYALPIVGALVLAAVVFTVVSGRLRDRDIDPTRAMREAARRIAELVETRFVVMGHTHLPAVVPFDGRVTYVNLGAWAVDEIDPSAAQASRTHLVLRWIDGEICAELLRWSPEDGQPVVIPSVAA